MEKDVAGNLLAEVEGFRGKIKYKSIQKIENTNPCFSFYCPLPYNAKQLKKRIPIYEFCP